MPSIAHIAARRCVALIVLLALCLAVAGAVATEPPADGLQPGQFRWTPELAPRGPLAIVVSLPAQRAHVYRNGVRIGTSTVSTGRRGFDTPPGIYTVLQKRREHYSNLYDDAPMPFMQRLTWDGLALHAGALPGYPASHGCVRLPKAFAELLFGATTPGTVVVIAASDVFPPSVVSPGLFSPVDAATGSPRFASAAPVEWEWSPWRAPDGPLTVLLSTADRQMVVLRNAIEIGRAAVAVRDTPAPGTRAYLLLEGQKPGKSLVVPDRPALRWLALPVQQAGQALSDDALRSAFESGGIVIPGEFARVLYDALLPGATVIVTDEPLQPTDERIDVLTSEGATGP